MWPTIGPLHSYGLFYLAAFLTHYAVSWRIARRSALQRRVWITVSTLFLVGSIGGAKLLYDVSHAQFSWRALLNPAHYAKGGLWGGLLAYFALATPAALALTNRRLAALDLIALSIPVPFLLAKLGCFLNGCCYGEPTSMLWAVVFPPDSHGAPPGVPRHPTQIYEMIVMLGVLLAFRRWDRDGWRGSMLLWFLAIYGAGRALCDAFRGDLERQIQLGPLDLTQWTCLGAALVSAALLVWWGLRKSQREGRMENGE